MTFTKPDEMIVAARQIAYAAHEGQTDKAGNPYIEHPERVAAAFDPRTMPDEHIVALLHDVVEDTSVTLNDLHKLFPSHIVAAVDAITKRPDETRIAYYARVKLNQLASNVKIEDVNDNSDPKRLARLDGTTRLRLEAKYAKARHALA